MLNRITLIGRLGQDAQTTDTYTRFSMATTKSWKDKATGEWQERTDWHNVTIWQHKELPKGALVFVEGEVQYSERDGKYYTNIVAHTLRWLNKPRSEAPLPEPTGQAHPLDASGVPF